MFDRLKEGLRRRRERRARLAAREVFTPSKPVTSREFFLGREKEIEKIVSHLTTPGKHAFLYGARGVGKSSLANVALARVREWRRVDRVVTVKCSAEMAFADLVAQLLLEVGVDVRVDSEESARSVGGGMAAGVPWMRGEASVENADKVVRGGMRAQAEVVGWVAERVRSLHVLFFVDEVEEVGGAVVGKLAKLIKQLSDYDASLKILVAGVSETLDRLVYGHLSVLRCLGDTHLDKMSDDEIADIVTHGARRLGVEFAAAAVDEIVRISSGFPHFTHLMALKACEQAIVEERRCVAVGDLPAAIAAAGEDVEGSLRNLYETSVRTHKDSARLVLVRILIAAAVAGEVEFSAARLRDVYGRLWGDENKVAWGYYMSKGGKIVAEDGTKILKLIGRGVYKFNDPRMASYIKFVNMDKLPNGNGG